MKIFEKEINKSWSLKLAMSGSKKASSLDAVDSITGAKIATIIYFASTGEVNRIISAEIALKSLGYNPKEHNNNWDEDGKIIIDDSGPCPLQQAFMDNSKSFMDDPNIGRAR